MAKRCVFYVEDGKVKRKVFDLPWGRGFDADAKIDYIYDSYEILRYEVIGQILDVTSANKTSQNGYFLSPFYLRAFDGRNLEDYYADMKQDDWTAEARMLYFEWIYGATVLSSNRAFDLIKQYNNFIDIFHRPDEKHCTQAKACAILKLAMQDNDLIPLYGNPESFYKWRTEHVNFVT